MTDYLTDDQISYIVHGYEQRTITHSIFLINYIITYFLSERQKIALHLRFRMEKPYREISEILGYKSTESGRRLIKEALKTIYVTYQIYKKKIPFKYMSPNGLSGIKFFGF